MKKALIWLVIIGGTLTGLANMARKSQYRESAPSTQSMMILSVESHVQQATVTPAPVGTPTVNPYLEISISQTAVAVEQNRLAQQSYRVGIEATQQYLRIMADSATSAAVAAGQQTQQAQQAVYAQQTVAAPATQMAYTAISADATQTATYKVQQYNADVVGMWMGKVFLILLALILLGGLAFLIVVTVRAWQLRNSQIRPDEAGRYPIVPEETIPGKSKRVINPNLQHRAFMGPQNDDLSAEQALLNTAHARQLEGIRAIASSSKMRSLTKGASKAGSSSSPVQPASRYDGNDQPLLVEYPLPEWSAWMQKWQPGLMALGINESGLLQVDPERYPHLMFVGTTGSGKTRFGVRTAVACALANGWQVVIAGKSLDYKPFEFHPNAHLVEFSLLNDPVRAVDLLRDVYAEIERRDRMMSQQGHSLWAQTGKPRTMVVVDEFSNLADALEDIDKSKREELWRWARMDTAEARKYGIHMVYALQDPTARSIDLRIRRNTTPVVFRVKDADSSRTILNTNGAELLPDRHFLAGMVKLERGAAFAPSDEEIIQFLAAHEVQTVDAPTWIDGEVVEDNGSRSTAVRSDQDDEPSIESRIRGVLLRMKTDDKVSLRQAEAEVYGKVSGGSHYTKVQEVWKSIQQEENTTTDSTTDKKTPNLGALAA